MKKETLGERIHRLRAKRGVTLQALAITVGVSAVFLLDLEHDRRKPSEGTLAELEKALGCRKGALRKIMTDASRTPRVIAWRPLPPAYETVALAARNAEIARLRALIDTPHIDNFLEAVRVEAAHQRERFGADHDAAKSPTDWIWLLGHLAGKACWAATHGDREKALHHTVSSAAMLLNWHAYMSGERHARGPGAKK